MCAGYVNAWYVERVIRECSVHEFVLVIDTYICCIRVRGRLHSTSDRFE